LHKLEVEETTDVVNVMVGTAVRAESAEVVKTTVVGTSLVSCSQPISLTTQHHRFLPSDQPACQFE
jgi:hypothetical protein